MIVTYLIEKILPIDGKDELGVLILFDPQNSADVFTSL